MKGGHAEIVGAGFGGLVAAIALAERGWTVRVNERRAELRGEGYGINEGPRLYEASLADVIGHMLKINAGSYSFECANPRHEHEYHLFERIKLPEGKVVCPGMITHASNIVEHPELIAERIMRFAKLVGRENVIAAADCGFSSQALYRTEVHHTVVWEKFKAMRQGADLATKMLWK